jgi:adenine specific DNA methylase Mod
MMKVAHENLLYYGDNLDVLRRRVAGESVDLVYLDPPFNSAQNYNVLFKERNGTEPAAQIRAFEDTWRWDQAAARAYQEIVEGGGKAAQAMIAFHSCLGANDMLAYLAMMAPRLVELRRVLKGTGSIWLHCDPTAGHYLKILMDAVFGAANFVNEIIWRRTTSHTTTTRSCGRITDTILFFSKSSKYRFNPPRGDHDEGYVKRFYRHSDKDGRRYRLHLVERNNALGARKNLIYEYKGYTPRLGWMMEREKLQQLDEQGKLQWSSRGRPVRKIYLDEVARPPLGNLWADIPPIQAQSAERLGYPTQKPEALLERIIRAGSSEGDLVLDPFCGCGTTLAVAQRLNRRWIGMDITQLAINLIKRRLHDSFGKNAAFKVIGEGLAKHHTRSPVCPCSSVLVRVRPSHAQVEPAKEPISQDPRIGEPTAKKG